MEKDFEKNGGVNVMGTQCALTGAEIDAIGEILNISMGSAATAISTMLEKQVIITTPRVSIKKFDKMTYETLEPAMLVKIEYISGISGSNIMVFRQNDMQIILNLLMGNDEGPTEDFVFDELSISAACEVMNQMMGASATALSSFLGKNINISTPTANVNDIDNIFRDAIGVDGDDKVVFVAFDLDIEDVMKSEFISVMTCELAKSIVRQVMGEIESTADSSAAPPKKAAPAPTAAQVQAPVQQVQQPQAPLQPQAPQYNVPNPQYQEQQSYAYTQYQPYPAMPGYPPYGYPPMPHNPQYAMPQSPQPGVIKQDVNVQSAQFPNFANQPKPTLSTPFANSNLDMMLNVPLSVSVEIGKTKKKIRDIMDFSQGTVIELEKQAGAPVDIVVNGQLIARGDVVVIDDNFGVRITEIVGTKDLVNSLENN